MDEKTAFCLLFVIMMPVSLTETKKETLRAVVGASITFPDPVVERGIIASGPKTIASVSKGEFKIEEDIYTNRLHWNNTGLFTLSGLQKNDSGVYTVDSKRGTVFAKYYDLQVYDPVPPPVVTAVNVSRDSCTLLCSVNKTEQTTLSWLKGEDFVDRSSSEVLLLTVQMNYNSTYRCVAENPAENKTVTVDIATVCKLETQSSGSKEGIIYLCFLIPIFMIILLLFLAFIVHKKCPAKKENTLFHSRDSVQYTVVNNVQRAVIESNVPDHQEALSDGN